MVNGEAFNVGRSGENYRIKDLAGIVREIVPNSEIAFADNAGPDLRNYRVDFSKIGKVLPAFQPLWTARQGAEELFASFQSEGLKRGEFESARYSRVAQLKAQIADRLLKSNFRWAPVADGSPAAPSGAGG